MRSTKARLLVLAALLVAVATAEGAAREKASEPDLSGTWTFNDEVTARLMQGLRDQGRPAFGGERPGGRGGPRGGPGGGRMRGAPGGPPSTRMQDLDELTIVQKDGEVTITDSGGRSRVFQPTGRKVKVDGPHGKETVRAGWKDGSLVVKIKPEKGPSRIETWTPSNDGRRLFLTLSMSDGPRMPLRRAYDRAGQPG
ncbi:MAG: hypothetical protein ABUT39_18480 [Acidobacteriota bacterium]